MLTGDKNKNSTRLLQKAKLHLLGSWGVCVCVWGGGGGGGAGSWDSINMY